MSDNTTCSIRFIDPSGLSTTAVIPAGTTVDVFLRERNINPDDVTVRVNRQEANLGTKLTSGDTVMASAAKVAGA